jgi:hypothetical protein
MSLMVNGSMIDLKVASTTRTMAVPFNIVRSIAQEVVFDEVLWCPAHLPANSRIPLL